MQYGFNHFVTIVLPFKRSGFGFRESLFLTDFLFCY